METKLAGAVSSTGRERAVQRVAVVAPRRELDGLSLVEAPWPGVLVDRVTDETFDDSLDALGGDPLALALIAAAPRDPGRVRVLRSRPERLRTRVSLLARSPPRPLPPVEDNWDVEGTV